MEETFVEIPEWPNVYVSPLGNLKQKKRIGKNWVFKQLTTYPDRDGKRLVNIGTMNIQLTRIPVADIVAKVFLGKPDDRVVRFKKGSNPGLSNIYYVGQKIVPVKKAAAPITPVKVKRKRITELLSVTPKINLCNKAVFPSKKEAEYKINYLNETGVGKKKNKHGLRAYPCGKCKGWHLTSKPLSGRKY
jgi:hypothetical protein